MCVHGTRVIVTPSSFSSSANKKPDLHQAAYTNHVASKGGGGSQGNVHVCLRRGEGGFDKSPRSFFGPNFSIVVGKFRFFLKRTKKICHYLF